LAVIYARRGGERSEVSKGSGSAGLSARDYRWAASVPADSGGFAGLLKWSMGWPPKVQFNGTRAAARPVTAL